MLWWRDSTALRRYILDTVMQGVALLRPGAALPRSSTVQLANAWRDAPLCLDSLELVSIASRLADALHLYDTELADLLLAEPSLSGWARVATESLERCNTQITFLSSGSSGEPTRHTLPIAHLCAETAQLATLLLPATSNVHAASVDAANVQATVEPHRTPATLWSLVPAHHIYGFLFTVLLPAQHPNSWQVQDARERLPASIARQLKPHDVVVAVPDFWQRWLDLGLVVPAGITLVTAAGRVESRVVTALAAQGARIVDIYGASETGGIGYRLAADDPFTLFSHWSRTGDTLRSNTHQAVLPDLLDWLSSSQFVVTARKDKAIQLSGKNVYPAQIAALIAQHPWVREAAVRPHELGLKAYIVPERSIEEDSLVTDLLTWLAQRLPPEQIPKYITQGSCLPRNEMGKLADWSVLHLV